MTVDVPPGVPFRPADEVHESPPEPHDLMLLLVEDNAADARLTQEHLRAAMPAARFEHVTRLAGVTADLALTADCALVDLGLPDANGLDVLHAIREMSDRLPIIVLTGFDSLELGISAIRQGAEDYLVKNYVDSDSLTRAIRYAIERRRLVLADPRAVSPSEFRSHTAGSTKHEGGGTHEVTVGIDAEGDYTLSCQTCGWKAGREPGPRHSWAERSLDATLLKHVAFGAREPSRSMLKSLADEQRKQLSEREQLAAPAEHAEGVVAAVDAAASALDDVVGETPVSRGRLFGLRRR